MNGSPRVAAGLLVAVAIVSAAPAAAQVSVRDLAGRVGLGVAVGTPGVGGRALLEGEWWFAPMSAAGLQVGLQGATFGEAPPWETALTIVPQGSWAFYALDLKLVASAGLGAGHVWYTPKVCETPLCGQLPPPPNTLVVAGAVQLAAMKGAIDGRVGAAMIRLDALSTGSVSLLLAFAVGFGS